VSYTCTGSRADQFTGGVYYADVSLGSSRSASAGVIPFAIIPGSLTVAPVTPVFKLWNQTVQVTPSVTQATGAAAATFAYAVSSGDCTLSAAAGASTLVQAGAPGTSCSITVTATAVTNGSAVGNSQDNTAAPLVVNVNDNMSATNSTASASVATVSVGGVATSTITVTVRDVNNTVITSATPTSFTANLTHAGGGAGTLGAFTCAAGICTATYTGTNPGTASIAVTINAAAVTGSPIAITINP